MEGFPGIIIILLIGAVSMFVKFVNSRQTATKSAPPPKPAQPSFASMPADQAAAAALWDEKDRKDRAATAKAKAETSREAKAHDEWQKRVDVGRQQSQDDRATEDAVIAARPAPVPGIALNFDAKSVVGGVIMHEVLTRPRAATRGLSSRRLRP